MIHQFCNTQHEGHVDSFCKILILKSSILSFFTHFKAADEVFDMVTNLPDGVDALIVDLLYNDINVQKGTRVSGNGKLFNNDITFTITPQSKEVITALDVFNNNEVVALLFKKTTSQLYGTTAQPLVFSYSEINGPAPGDIKGYQVNVTGDTYGECFVFNETNINVFLSCLAEPLPKTL